MEVWRGDKLIGKLWDTDKDSNDELKALVAMYIIDSKYSKRVQKWGKRPKKEANAWVINYELLSYFLAVKVLEVGIKIRVS